MNKHLTTALFLLLTCGLANADAGFFIRGKVGLTDWSDNVFQISNNTITFDNSIRASAGVEGGYLFANGIALSAESMFSSVEATNETAGPEEGIAEEGSLVALATYYFPTGNSFQPFIGVGAGVYSIEISESNTNAELSGYTGQVRLGALMQFSKKITGFIEYKYFSIDVDDENNLAIKTNAWFFGGGVSWHF